MYISGASWWGAVAENEREQRFRALYDLREAAGDWERRGPRPQSHLRLGPGGRLSGWPPNPTRRPSTQPHLYACPYEETAATRRCSWRGRPRTRGRCSPACWTDSFIRRRQLARLTFCSHPCSAVCEQRDPVQPRTLVLVAKRRVRRRVAACAGALDDSRPTSRPRSSAELGTGFPGCWCARPVAASSSEVGRRLR
jgi:hypothetical protein